MDLAEPQAEIPLETDNINILATLKDLIFGGGFGGGKQNSGGFGFDFGDLFGGGFGAQNTKSQKKSEPKKEKVENLDVIETVAIPFLDFLSDQKISVKTVYGKNLTLKVKAFTQPGTKFKIAGK